MKFVLPTRVLNMINYQQSSLFSKIIKCDSYSMSKNKQVSIHVFHIKRESKHITAHDDDNFMKIFILQCRELDNLPLK
jgi:hypothetical protein